MKKISILALHLGYGGIEKSIVGLANMLVNKYDIEIAVCYKCGFDRTLLAFRPRNDVPYVDAFFVYHHFKMQTVAFSSLFIGDEIVGKYDERCAVLVE